ncbi:MAG: hypothetical protein D6797_03130 [Bdellovibrio sp.]|nr:MAG: hypothetical protein D6797_03130 [Bdellovibrio sp.]
MTRYLRSILSVLIFSYSLPLMAYYSTLTTGNLLPEEAVDFTGELQFLTDKSSGANIVGRLDGGLNEDMNWRGEFGIGQTDFHFGGFVKWIPFPDWKKQPALGVMAGGYFARYSSLNEISLRIHPLISKNFQTDFGRLTPYGSLPLGLRSYDGETVFPLQLVVGTEFQHKKLKDFSFLVELGFNLANAPSYLSLGFRMALEDDTIPFQN